MINKERIMDKTHVSEVLYFTEITSTNTYLKDYGKVNSDKKHVLVVADSQTKGRGRLHKSFYSPDSGLYFSLLYRFPLSIQKLQLITITAAVAVAKTLKDLYRLDVKIKWLNDIYLNQRKLCGILTEGVLSQGNHYDFIVLGIGINVKTPQRIPEELEGIFAALDEEINNFDKETFLIHFINNFDQYMNNLERYQENIISTYKDLCFILNKNIRILNSDKLLFAYDINSEGHLLTKDEDNKVHQLNSGEVSIIYED